MHNAELHKVLNLSQLIVSNWKSFIDFEKLHVCHKNLGYIEINKETTLKKQLMILRFLEDICLSHTRSWETSKW